MINYSRVKSSSNAKTARLSSLEKSLIRSQTVDESRATRKFVKINKNMQDESIGYKAQNEDYENNSIENYLPENLDMTSNGN